MSAGLIFDNVVAYSLQIGMLVGVAACVPVLLRLRQPGAKLIYWQILLATCILLPLQRWKQTVIVSAVELPAVMGPVRMVSHQTTSHLPPRSEIALLLLLSGVAIRLGCLAVGLWKLRRYRRHSRSLDPAPTWSVEADVRISNAVASPVTFGWRKPVVLLPANFPDLDARVQEAILCHEVMHVRRRDWLITVAEEVVRAIFWFHPAIWWLLGEIGLAREQEVDRLAIDITHERDEYMDALLAIAGSRAQLDLAPAPLFLRKRHLKHRVVLILKEARMSKTHLISTLATGLGILAAACWLATGVFPLTAQPLVINDAPGVTVNLNGASVLHRTGVDYPFVARQHEVQGTLSVEVLLDASGNVADEHVLSGPDELRKPVLQSLLQWHFTHEAAGTTRTVQIQFELPKRDNPAVLGYRNGAPITPADAVREQALNSRGGVVGGVAGGVIGGVPGGVTGVAGGGPWGTVIDGMPTGVPEPPIRIHEVMGQSTLQASSRIANIRVLGLSEPSQRELLALLPVHEGDELTEPLMANITSIAKAYDEHLQVRRMVTSSATGTQMGLVIALPGQQMIAPAFQTVQPAAFSSTEPRTVVAPEVEATRILRKVAPSYPPLAKNARVSGVVHLAAIIGSDGYVKELRTVGGPALLIQAAMDAVKEWVFEPSATAVETTIDVNFTLNQ